MRKDYNQDPQPSFVLTVDCPLNNSLNDISGNNNHLTAVSGGTPVFVNDPTDSSIKVGQFNTDLQGLVLSTLTSVNYINNFKIELDFYKLTTWTNVSYPNLIDGCASGSHSGQFTQRVNSTMYFGVINKPTGYYLEANTSTLSVNTWYHLRMENYSNKLYVIITKNSDNSLIHYYTVATPTITSVPYPNMYLGRSIYHGGRTWGGYIKNFKLYI